MTERDFLAERFEEHRTRLKAVAYRMLGSLAEADDAVPPSPTSGSPRSTSCPTRTAWPSGT